MWVGMGRSCGWSTEGAVGGVQKKTNCHTQFPRAILLQLPLLQGRWERGVEEGVANRYGRGRVCGSGGGSHRGRLRLFGSWVSLFNGLWSHACSASVTFPDCIHPWHEVYLPTHPTLIAGEGLWDAHAGEATGACRELESSRARELEPPEEISTR